MTDLMIWGVKNKEDWRMSHCFFWNLRIGWNEQVWERGGHDYIYSEYPARWPVQRRNSFIKRLLNECFMHA